MTRLYKKLLIFFVIFLNTPCKAIDNPHFYRANFFWGEPRFEKPWLATHNFHVAGGHAEMGRNADGQTVPILNIFGLQNMHVLGNTPGLDPADPLDEILINLAAVPAREDFGKLEFTGKFRTIELIFDFYQNLVNGFFVQAYLPVRHLKIERTKTFIDRSPDDDIFPNRNTPQWVAFLNNFDPILKKFDLSKDPTNETGAGDFSFLAGWTTNYEGTKKLDFIDVNAKIGALFPTGKRANLTDPFDLPLGYNGFYGVPLKFDLSIGYWEWLTAGLHLGALFLLEQTREFRLQPVANQSPYFLLLKGEAEFDPGTIWEISSYLKADHIYRGLSLYFGYCYTQKDEDCVQPKDPKMFDPSIVNSNLQLQSWNMHVLHFGAEWDFTKKPVGVGPRFGFFYNYIVAGKRIFNTAIKDAYLGIDIAYCY